VGFGRKMGFMENVLECHLKKYISKNNNQKK